MEKIVSSGECGGRERIKMKLCAGKTNWNVVRAEKIVVVHGNHVLLQM